MDGLRLSREPALPPSSMGVVLGSFDPPHHGHGWIVEQLQRRFEAVLLLVPARHFHKRVRVRHNATLQQRIALLELAHPEVLAGIADEVLFVRLHALLQRRFPGAEIGLGMGSETLGRLLASRRYFARVGLPWGLSEERALRRVLRRVVTFDRDACPAGPGISSTRVRRLAAALHARGAPPRAWQRELGPLVAPGIVTFVRTRGLYRGVTRRGVLD